MFKLKTYITEILLKVALRKPTNSSDLNINLKYTGYYFLSKEKEKKKSRKKEKIASYLYAIDFTVYTYYLMY